VLGAQFTFPERAAEGPAYLEWFARRGFITQAAKATNEGEGDIRLAGDVILAGTGFRTELAGHAEAQELFGRPVIGLQLVDPRYYHLDTALAVLSDTNVAYFPEAFTPGSQAVLRRMYPDAVIATADDAAVLGLNMVSDGRHVVLPTAAPRLAQALASKGFQPVPVDVSELNKAGGGPKCCTLEVRQ
jgi:N-dimethylarginine dimethylaminohydrolase